MTQATAMRLALCVLWSGANLMLAVVLRNETGWRSWVTALLACSQVVRLERVADPQPHLLAAAVAACLLVVVASAPGLRRLRLAAFVVCTLSATTLQLADDL